MRSQYLAVNATSQDLWPDRLDGENISSDCKIVSYYQPKIRPSCFTVDPKKIAYVIFNHLGRMA